MYTTVVRNNTEVAYITNNKNYMFNYQNYNFLQNPVTLKKVQLSHLQWFSLCFFSKT